MWWPQRGPGTRCRGDAAWPRTHGGEHVRQLAGHGAGLSHSAALPLRRSRWTAVAAARLLSGDPLRARPDVSTLPCAVGVSAYLFGFMNLSVIRSDSPMARYLSRSWLPSVSVGGSVHTPFA